jgi:hypothetical protein
MLILDRKEFNWHFRGAPAEAVSPSTADAAHVKHVFTYRHGHEPC